MSAAINNIFIEGFALSNYRSFGETVQQIGPFNKINIFVGQNNSGKSNILSFLAKHYKNATQIISHRSHPNPGIALMYEDLDKHIGSTAPHQVLGFCTRANNERFQSLIPLYNDHRDAANQKAFSVVIEDLLASNDQEIICNQEFIWWFYRIPLSAGTTDFDDKYLARLKSKIKNPLFWSALWSTFTAYSGGSIDSWIPSVLDTLSPVQTQLPDITLIPAIRRVGEEGSKTEDFSGIGIIERLAQLQNPGWEVQDHKTKFSEINHFLQTVVGNPTAQLEIPHDRKMILVHMDGRTLPLSSLGTGIHEVIILASAATVLQNQIMCIEELEIHLHPILQRKLLRYLQDKTDNQYFITTHSAHLLDAPNAAIFHVRHHDGQTQVEPAYTPTERALICSDLGYRSSDLLQANCIIWVEGPSDRIYINHWLKSSVPNLVEGLHYSIMFYGGRLLSHLTADDPEITDFISLRRLNRYMSIVIDSDRKTGTARINKTKKRVQGEFKNEDTGFAWITKGKEIENYVDFDVLNQSVLETHKNLTPVGPRGQYEDNLAYVKGTKPSNVDKIKIAHDVVRQPANLDVLDLRSMVSKLVKFIQSANDDETIIVA